MPIDVGVLSRGALLCLRRPHAPLPDRSPMCRDLFRAAQLQEAKDFILQEMNDIGLKYPEKEGVL